MIPAEAVRAAFIAIYERDHIGGVGSADIRRALEAAAPYMLADAWEQGRDAEFQRSVMKRQTDPNPYMLNTEGEK